MFIRYNYKTTGSHASQIDIILEDGIIQQAVFHQGCNGNVQGLSRLVRGMKAEDVIARLKGVPCRKMDGTSCPDQLARGLEEALAMANVGQK